MQFSHVFSHSILHNGWTVAMPDYRDDQELNNESRDKYILRRLREDREKVETIKEGEALDKQIGGDHYKDCKIQPVEYIHANQLDYFEGNVIKYVTRHRTKGEGKKDIEKAIHYAELILELYYK